MTTSECSCAIDPLLVHILWGLSGGFPSICVMTQFTLCWTATKNCKIPLGKNCVLTLKTCWYSGCALLLVSSHNTFESVLRTTVILIIFVNKRSFDGWNWWSIVMPWQRNKRCFFSYVFHRMLKLILCLCAAKFAQWPFGPGLKGSH